MTNLSLMPTAKDFEGRKSSSGLDCQFYRVGDVGLKLFRNEGTRDDSYDKQDFLYHEGLAPRVGHTFEVEFAGETYYGHTTEIAETIVDTSGGKNKDKHGRGMGEQFHSRDDYVELGCKIADCMDKLHEANCRWHDDHAGNFGLIDGEVVIIDCAGVYLPHECDEDDYDTFFNEWDKYRRGYEYGDDPEEYL